MQLLPSISGLKETNSLSRCSSRYFFGIDLGTTNSVASVVDAEAIAVSRNEPDG